jgi:hypothetical protein
MLGHVIVLAGTHINFAVDSSSLLVRADDRGSSALLV